jgi:hypothetical protein
LVHLWSSLVFRIPMSEGITSSSTMVCSVQTSLHAQKYDKMLEDSSKPSHIHILSSGTEKIPWLSFHWFIVLTEVSLE